MKTKFHEFSTWKTTNTGKSKLWILYELHSKCYPHLTIVIEMRIAAANWHRCKSNITWPCHLATIPIVPVAIIKQGPHVTMTSNLSIDFAGGNPAGNIGNHSHMTREHTIMAGTPRTSYKSLLFSAITKFERLLNKWPYPKDHLYFATIIHIVTIMVLMRTQNSSFKK